MPRTKYLPDIAWVSRPHTLRSKIYEGIDYCRPCAEKLAEGYREAYPSERDCIRVGGGNDPARTADSPAACYECHSPLACVVDGKLLDTLAKWSRHP